MTVSDVLALLEANKNERGIKNWAKLYPADGGLKTFGIGLTVLRKLAKQVGKKNHELAMELWESDYYDARIIGMLIDDPKQLTRELAESQVEKLDQGYLAHTFSSCDATLAKTSYVVELLLDWVVSDDPIRRRCGYGLLYEVSKSKKKSAPEDPFFLERIDHIQKSYKDEEDIEVVLSMGGALMGMGMRNKVLNAAALVVAREIGPIDFAPDNPNCDPFDAVKHLTGPHAKKKLGL